MITKKGTIGVVFKPGSQGFAVVEEDFSSKDLFVKVRLVNTNTTIAVDHDELIILPLSVKYVASVMPVKNIKNLIIAEGIEKVVFKLAEELWRMKTTSALFDEKPEKQHEDLGKTKSIPAPTEKLKKRDDSGFDLQL